MILSSGSIPARANCFEDGDRYEGEFEQGSLLKGSHWAEDGEHYVGGIFLSLLRR